MTTHYLGNTHDGRIVSRASTNPGFTHAAIYDATDWGAGAPPRIPSFGTSREGAARNFRSSWGDRIGCEVVTLRKVDAAEYRAATKGIDPKSGRPR